MIDAPPLRRSLGRRILSAGAWIVGGNVLGQGLRLLTNIALTRLLFPDAFGLMAVVNILITALALFSDIGVIRTVVQSPRGDQPELLDTAWTLQIARGFALAAGCLLAGGGLWAAQFAHGVVGKTVYADPRLPPMLMAFAVAPAISGFDSMRNGLARRAMQLRPLVKIDLFAQAAAAVAMLVVGALTRSYWTLIVGAGVAALARCLLGHAVLPGPRERLRVDRSCLQEILATAKWIFLSSIFTFLAANADRLLLGGLTDTRTLGLYAIALLSVNVLQGVASNLAASVVYPALAEVARERPAGLEPVLRRFQWVYDLFFVGIASMLVAAGPALVDVIYDVRYHEAGWMLRVLAVGAIGWRVQVVEQCYQAVGRVGLMMTANLVRLLALLLAMAVGHAVDGVVGLVHGVAVAPFAAWPVALRFKARQGLLTLGAEAAFVPALIGGLAAGWLLARGLAFAFPARMH